MKKRILLILDIVILISAILNFLITFFVPLNHINWFIKMSIDEIWVILLAIFSLLKNFGTLGKTCMYCKENGIKNDDVFIEIIDEELGPGWVCKECFVESQKENHEYLKEVTEAMEQLNSRNFEICTDNSLKLARIEYLEDRLEKIKREIDAELKEIDDEKAICHEDLRGTMYQILNIIKEALRE